MQKLNINHDETMSRKDYLKDKKKKHNRLNKRGRRKLIVLGIITLLACYVFFQFYVYYKENNYIYSTDDNVDKQEVYDMYYLSEGYTYEPKTSLNTMTTDGLLESQKEVAKNIGFTNITEYGDFIYGIRENGLYKINKLTGEVSVVLEDDVNKFTTYKDEIYLISTSENILKSVDKKTLEIKEYDVKNVKEILVDENSLYLCVDDLEKSNLVKINKDGSNKQNLTEDKMVSYVIQDETRLYYVNKDDENKLYSINKDGSDLKKVADIKSVADKGDTDYIDGSKYMFIKDDYLYYINVDDNRNLWKKSLISDENVKVISNSIEILDYAEDTVFYKINNEMGVYLFNLNTTFTSQITDKLIKEFIIER